MNEVLKHSEVHITKIANEAAHVRTTVTQIIRSKSPFSPPPSLPQKPIMQYLQEIHILGAEDRLPDYVPSSILIQHYVAFRIALRRYVRASSGGQWGYEYLVDLVVVDCQFVVALVVGSVC